MKEHYVTYDQAVKLKELGFDGECNQYYLCDNQDTINHTPGAHNHNDNGLSYSAPTLDQAQAWLREIKGIDIEPRVWLVGNKREYRPYVMPYKCKDYIACPPSDKYEQALSAGISKALELLGKEEKE